MADLKLVTVVIRELAICGPDQSKALYMVLIYSCWALWEPVGSWGWTRGEFIGCFECRFSSNWFMKIFCPALWLLCPTASRAIDACNNMLCLRYSPGPILTRGKKLAGAPLKWQDFTKNFYWNSSLNILPFLKIYSTQNSFPFVGEFFLYYESGFTWLKPLSMCLQCLWVYIAMFMTPESWDSGIHNVFV